MDLQEFAKRNSMEMHKDFFVSIYSLSCDLLNPGSTIGLRREYPVGGDPEGLYLKDIQILVLEQSGVSYESLKILKGDSELVVYLKGSLRDYLILSERERNRISFIFKGLIISGSSLLKSKYRRGALYEGGKEKR